MLARPSLVLAGLLAAGIVFADSGLQHRIPAFQSPPGRTTGAPLLKPGVQTAPRHEGGTIALENESADALRIPQEVGGGGDGFGQSFTTLGDVYGDGAADFAIGGPFVLNPSGTSGIVNVYDGAPGGTWDDVTTLRGFASGEGFGVSVAGVGDVNGDGFPDLLVGAPYRTTGGHPNCGKAYLFLGSAVGYSQVPSWTFETLVDVAFVGLDVAWAGDVNRDGYDDWMVAAPYHSEGEENEGAVYLFYGSAGALSNVPVWTQTSDHVGAFFGYSIAGVGDVNGDGYADLAIGAPGDENPLSKNSNEGSVSLFAGAPGIPSHTPIKKWYAQQSDAALGTSVSAAGDLDADGYADFIAGAPYYSDGQANQGIAHVYFGGPVFALMIPPVKVKQSIAGAHFGWGVGSAGDVNGDGYADFIVGAPDTPQPTGEGAAYLYYGTSARSFPSDFDEIAGSLANGQLGGAVGQLGDINGDGRAEYAAGEVSFVSSGLVQYRFGEAIPFSYFPELTSQGYYENTFLGTSSATADMDGDGYDDLIVGSPQGGQDADNKGYLALYRGGPNAFQPAGLTPYLGAVPDWTYVGTQPFGLMGWSMANAGDVNADGYEDLIAGGWGYANGETTEGRALLFFGSPSGPAGSPVWDVEGNEANSYFGFSVAGGGDLDGDGYDDVAVGQPLAAAGGTGRGAVRVYKGSALGPAQMPWVVLPGLQDDANFGVSCAIAGDIDRDGYDDLVVGAPFHSDGQADEGRILVYRGSATGVHAFSVQEIQVDIVGAEFGYVVSRIGDVNADGYADVAVGAPYYTNDQDREGMVQVFYGSPAGLITPASWTVEGDQVELYLGQYGLAGAGDFNGDGYGDFFLGLPNYDDGAEQDAGGVKLFGGGPGGLDTSPYLDFIGGSAFGYLGVGGGGMADFNGDGQSDYFFTVPGFTLLAQSEGAVGVTYGNLWNYHDNNPARPIAAWRTDLSAPIGAGLRSNANNAFLLKGTGRSPAGRTRMRIEYEVKQQATPFNFAGRGFGAWTSGAAVVPGQGSTAALTANVTGLGTGQRYHWRARYRSSSPLFPWTPWFGVESTTDTERMLVTNGAPGVIGVDPAPAATLALVSPSPNPSFGTVALAFDLPRAGEASLVLYGVDGRRVRTLFAGRADAGRTTLTWDGRDAAGREVPAGAYFARVSFAGEEKVGKIVRLR